uniref:Ig-like domain-containing protein n=1 Tax=Glossina brevipalpis TaxID=37001 RepID=A0A1A9W0H3_9MUSC
MVADLPVHKKIFTWYEGETSTSELFIGRLHLIDHADYGKASANLTSIRESDQGWYHCQIIFPNRTPSARNNGTWYHLAVQGGSLIKIPPINQTLMEGQTAFFHCVMKYPDISMASWYKDGVLLQDIPDLMRRSFMGPHGSLSIDPTMMSDYGEYECQVRNNENKAKVIYAPPEVYLPYGQPAVLDCHFRANPPLKNLRWEKDGLLFDSYNVPGVFYKMNGSLFFSKVDENYAGSYTCTPFNELGTDGPSPVINVIVLRPPIFTVTPKAIYIQKLGETVELPCQAIDRDGSNHPSIDWKRLHAPKEVTPTCVKRERLPRYTLLNKGPPESPLQTSTSLTPDAHIFLSLLKEERYICVHSFISRTESSYSGWKCSDTQCAAVRTYLWRSVVLYTNKADQGNSNKVVSTPNETLLPKKAPHTCEVLDSIRWPAGFGSSSSDSSLS